MAGMTPYISTGPKALETFDWAKAAGMQGFQTYWDRCRDALRNRDLDWPEGVTFVDYPDNEGKIFKISKP